MYRKNIYSDKKQDVAEIEKYSEGYKDFLTYGKTERLCVKKSVELLEKAGFENIENKTSLKSGDKVYMTNRAKNVCAFIIGKKPIEEGLRILGAHIDSPRLDVKQNPLYEKDGFALLDTHYYGGIKYYQWVTIPLAIHGVMVRKDGSLVDINIGEEVDDPVFGIGDLLIHLSKDQQAKTLGQAIEGENLDITLGSRPLDGEDKNAVKANIMKILSEKYGVEEEDFVSAELEIVPAGPARDYGLDRSMIASYGHDDRSCAYASLKAILDIDNPEYTSCCILVDKEEVGSIGATGAHSLFFENAIAKLAHLNGSKDAVYTTRIAFEHSKMLSSDVSAGVDPLYPSVNEVKNSCYLNNGIVFNKYTGARGKSGCNDASPEYISWIRKILDERKVCYQTAELGKVDQGGGGTIAYILGNYNMDVLDAGIAVLNMHAPMEIVSKADCHEAYLAYKAFLIA